MSNAEAHRDEPPYDLEDCAKQDKPPPETARRFRIRIDKQHFIVEQPEMTGREILALAAKDPQRFKLVQRLRGQKPKKIDPDETVDFRTPGIERFNVMACDQTEGDGPRRDFLFAAEDVEYLDALGLNWETIVEGNARWLVIYGYGVPTGYTHSVVDVALQMPPGYPDTQIDMVFFHPPLVRKDGKQIKATQGTATVRGRVFQRWSRHRTGQNPWRPGVDSIVTHMFLVEEWLAREFSK